MGKTQTWVSNHMRLLSLPPAMQEKVANFEVGVGTALRPYRAKRRVVMDRLGDPGDTQTTFITMNKTTHKYAIKQARKQRQTFEAFVEENIVLAIDWRAFGIDPPLEERSAS